MTKERERERASEESEEKYRTLVETSFDGIIIHQDGLVVFVNPAAIRLLGAGSADEIIGTPVMSFVHPDYRSIVHNRIATATREVQPVVEEKFLRIDGSSLDVDVAATPFTWKNKPAVHVVFHDITRRRKYEEELRAANEQLMATGEEMRAQYEELAQSERQIRDSDSRLRYLIGFYEQANKGEKELLRYAVEGAGVVTNSPLGYLAFLNEDESELSMYSWSENAMSECSMREKPIVYKTEHTGLWGETVRQRLPVITNDYQAPDAKKKGYPKGHPHIVRHMGVPVIDEGHIKLTAGVANKPSDYTEYDANELALLMQGLWQVLKRKQTEESLQESETKFREIFDNVNDAVELHEINEQGIPGKFIDMNAVACRMVQYTKDEMLQKGPLDITTDYHSIPLPQIEEELKVRGQVIFETEHKRKDGHIIPVEINSHVVVIHGRKMVLSVVRDISERKKTEEAIRQANRKLNLLSSITRHDVANQLTVVQGYAQSALAKESVSGSRRVPGENRQSRVPDAGTVRIYPDVPGSGDACTRLAPD